MRSYHIYLIRHGLTKANLEGKYIGETDLDLCEEGVSELLSLKEQFVYPAVGRVYSSPLRRSVQTARLLYPEMKIRRRRSLKSCPLIAVGSTARRKRCPTARRIRTLLERVWWKGLTVSSAI